MCAHTLIFVKKKSKKIWRVLKNVLPLQRYPENNLFTLKELIPIEDKAVDCEVHRFCHYLNLCTLFVYIGVHHLFFT